MIYRSNLEAPDLASIFALRDPPLERLGHDIPSDPHHLPDCGYFSHDEAAILHNVAASVGGIWADIGARLGWTSAHVTSAGAKVYAVDPEFLDPAFLDRFIWQSPLSVPMALKAEWFFDVARWKRWKFDGFVIDGNHDAPEPTNDSAGALSVAKEDAVIVFHDVWGKPVRDAMKFLMSQGWSCRVYWTPAGVSVCWRGLRDWVPPFHVRDPAVDWGAIRLQMKDFRFEECI